MVTWGAIFGLAMVTNQPEFTMVPMPVAMLTVPVAIESEAFCITYPSSVQVTHMIALGDLLWSDAQTPFFITIYGEKV